MARRTCERSINYELIILKGAPAPYSYLDFGVRTSRRRCLV